MKVPVLLSLAFPVLLLSEDRSPQVEAVQPGVRLTLLAEHPALATPTGIDVDESGNVWVVACHTHMPPPDYPGPKWDEVLVFSPDGRRRVFYQGGSQTMDLELGPDGWVYLAERDRIFRIKDTDGDGKSDVSEDLAHLKSEANYPHNALSALAWHRDGSLWFGLGENFAKPWILSGNDRGWFQGTGEGGIFRMNANGTGLHRVARGMWNPFGLCIRSDGEVFASDNDPGESPPCRLLHIVEGGDYGYNRVYGSDAHHPFVGWNGELRGTLPMVHPTGEAPCGVAELGRGLIVPSWSDHRIDFMPLTRKGASYSARRIALVQGGPYFRPTCIAPVPGQTAWVLADWVDGRYPVHGYGRLWKLEIDLAAASWVGTMELEAPNEAARQAADLRNKRGPWDRASLLGLAGDADPFIARAALLELSKSAASWTPEDLRGLPPSDRVNALLAMRMTNAGPKWPRFFLADPDPAVSFEALRWISEAVATALLPDVEAFLTRSDLDFSQFEAALAARNTLLGKPEVGVRDPELLLAKVRDASCPPRIRTMALRLLPSLSLKSTQDGLPPAKSFPKGLTLELLDELLAEGDEALSLEAVRTLADQPSLSATRLAAIAADSSRSPELRAEALSGLQAVAPDHRALLVQLTADPAPSVRDEALRGLRGLELAAEDQAALRSAAASHPECGEAVRAILEPGFLASGRPAPGEVDAWIKRLDAVSGEPDPEAGRRIFHGTRMALCANCHRREGRGQVVGPDLSHPRERRLILESILDPNAAIAPEYSPRQLDLTDGTSFIGIRLRSSTQEVMRDIYGQNRAFTLEQIAAVHELETSFMPPGLAFGMTDRELRDLIAWLSQ